jgi:hypothetical protein
MRRRTLLPLLGAFVAWSAAACDAERRVEKAALRLEKPAPEVQRSAARAVFAAPVVAEAKGNVTLRSGEKVDSGADLSLDQDAAIALDFAPGARVRVLGPARVRIAPHEEQGLLVHHGLVSIDFPEAGKAESLWIACAAARFELAPNTRAAMSASAQGDAFLSVASGRVSVLAATDTATSAADREPVIAGETLLLSASGAVERGRGPVKLEQAQTLAAKSEPSATPVDEVRGALAQRLEAALRGLREAETYERELLARHAQLAEQGDPDAMSVQRSLAVHAAQSFRQQRVLKALLARYESLTLTSSADELALRATKALHRL